MKSFLKLFLFMPMLLVAGCSSDNDDEPNDGEDSGKYSYLEEKLFDTSWKLESSYTLYYDDFGNITKTVDNTVPSSSSDASKYQTFLNTVFTFASDKSQYGGYCFYQSTVPGEGSWRIDDDGCLKMFNSYYIGGNPAHISAYDMGFMSRFLPSTSNKIESISSDRISLSLYFEDRNYRKEWVLKRIYGYVPDTGSGSGSDSGSSYEKPEIGIEDYTCYTTSITLKYRIYNQDQAKVSSAKGYYGKNSPVSSVSADVAGSLITIRVTGLSKGTTYYFKCSATGPGGTTTSETTKLSTTTY